LTEQLALLLNEAIKSLAARHDLADAWQRFESRFLND
jgi:hypothetical protein